MSLGVPENPTEVPDCYDCDLLTRYVLKDFLEDGRAYNKIDPTFLPATGAQPTQ